MSHTITGKLNKPAREFQAGEYTGFGIGLGVQYYDRQTKQKEWTNYKTAVFSKNPQQIDFYRQALVAGSIVSVTAKHQKIDTFDGNNGQVIMIELVDADIVYVGATQQPQQAPQQQYQQPAQQMQQQPQVGGAQVGGANMGQPQQPAPQPQGFDNSFDDDIPF